MKVKAFTNFKFFCILRTKPVVIVEASLKHPDSVNRTNLECVENGQPAVCMNLMVCFTYKGREVPGYIGKVFVTYFNIFSKMLIACLDLF